MEARAAALLLHHAEPLHLVLWPRRDGELAEYLRWLTVSHVQRWHAHYHTSGSGSLYQGRFKSFPIQQDDHLLTVCRYVERNALRAGMVARVEAWRWSSLRQRSDATIVGRLDTWPIAVPGVWVSYGTRRKGDIVNCLAVTQPSESNGDAGDKYTGLDRFGGVVDQRWINMSTGTATDRFQYAYDRDGNRVYCNNLAAQGRKRCAFREKCAENGRRHPLPGHSTVFRAVSTSACDGGVALNGYLPASFFREAAADSTAPG